MIVVTELAILPHTALGVALSAGFFLHRNKVTGICRGIVILEARFKIGLCIKPVACGAALFGIGKFNAPRIDQSEVTLVRVGLIFAGFILVVSPFDAQRPVLRVTGNGVTFDAGAGAFLRRQ